MDRTSDGDPGSGPGAEDQARRAKVVERVRLMLAKAASTDHEAEAQVFEERALALMAAHEIEERELRDATPHEPHDIACGHFGHAQYAAVVLCVEVAGLFGAYGVMLRHQRKFTARLMCTSAQLDLTMPLVDHLLAQLMADLNRDRPRSRKDYALGWVNRVLIRLTEARARVYDRAGALVPTVASSAEAYHQQFGTPARGRRQQVGPDFVDGQAAGEEADLNQERLPG